MIILDVKGGKLLTTCVMEVGSRIVTLAECPVGLFFTSDGKLCFKTKYQSDDGRIDAYILDSGEHFCGDGKTKQQDQRVVSVILTS